MDAVGPGLFQAPKLLPTNLELVGKETKREPGTRGEVGFNQRNVPHFGQAN